MHSSEGRRAHVVRVLSRCGAGALVIADSRPFPFHTPPQVTWCKSDKSSRRQLLVQLAFDWPNCTCSYWPSRPPNAARAVLASFIIPAAPALSSRPLPFKPPDNAADLDARTLLSSLLLPFVFLLPSWPRRALFVSATCFLTSPSRHRPRNKLRLSQMARLKLRT